MMHEMPLCGDETRIEGHEHALARRGIPPAAIQASDFRGCECPRILRGVKKPTDCKLLGAVCTRENSMGSCMVASEGACEAYWSDGRFRQPGEQQESAARAQI